MSDDSKLTITRRRALGSLLTFGAATAAVGGGTGAYFSDQADSEDNTIKAGNIDLQTNGNNNPTTAINVGPVTPGDNGGSTLRLDNTGSVDGFVTLVFGTPDTRNDLTEVLEVTIKVAGNVVRKGTFDTVFDGEGEYSNADVPLPSGSSRILEFEYTLPESAGNDVQNEVAEADISIQLNQQEETFADIVVDQSGGGNVATIQDGVESTPDGGVVLVRDGTYTEAVNVTKSGVKIASKNGPSSTEIVANADTQNNRAIQIDGVDDVTVDGFRVSLASPQSDNSEKYGIRGRPDGSGSGPDNLTVRNCVVEDITSEDVSSNSGAVRATAVVVDLDPTGNLGPATATNFVVENNTIQNIKCVGDVDQSDSRAKGISVNGDLDGASFVRNDILDIGVASGSSESPDAAESVTLSGVEGTEKPRGVSITEAGPNDDGTTQFTILDNLIRGVEGTFGQPAIFIGGTNGLGADHEVYDNEFHHPVDNLSADALILRNNTWVNDKDGDGIPELVPPDQDEDGGNLIDRGASAYDTTYTI